MTKFRTLIRSLIKNRVTSVITIIGFSVSISMALIIIAFLPSRFREIGIKKSVGATRWQIFEQFITESFNCELAKLAGINEKSCRGVEI